MHLLEKDSLKDWIGWLNKFKHVHNSRTEQFWRTTSSKLSVPRHTNCSRLYFIVHMNMFIVNIKVLLELEFLPVHFLSDGIQTVHSVPQLLSTMLQVKNVFIA